MPVCTGATAPTAALDQEAAKNSSLVESRSAALERIRSSSKKMISVFVGIRSSKVSCSSINNGINDSMPSVAIPAAIRSNISAAAGNLVIRSFALTWISWVNKSSRQGKISSLPITGSDVRWPETSK